VRAVNLIPVDQRSDSGPAAGRSEGAVFFVLALLGGLAVMALLYGMAHRSLASKHGEAAAITAQAQAAEAQVQQLAPYTSFIAMDQQREQALSQLVDARFDWAHTIHELGRVLPSTVALNTITGVSGTGQNGSSSSAGSAAGAGGVASATPPGTTSTVTLAGCATSQAEVAYTLERLRLMDGVANVALQSSTKSGSGGGSSSGCLSTDPAFSIELTYAPLPTGSPTATSAPAATPGASGRSTVAAPVTARSVTPARATVASTKAGGSK
jgi:Tfp pilus assembly protein PilN